MHGQVYHLKPLADGFGLEFLELWFNFLHEVIFQKLMNREFKEDELASTLRAMLALETEQVNRRLSWFGTLQGFLFASLAFTWDKNRTLTIIISMLGMVVALLVLIGLIAVTLSLERIRNFWLKNKPPHYKGPDIFGFYPDKAKFTVYTSPEILLPLAFMIAWICILFIKPPG